MENRSFKVDQLAVKVYRNRKEMGEAAGKAVANRLRILLAHQPRVRMIFAAAPSQQEMLDVLVRADGINWKSVTAFHMDEYIGLPEGAEQSFGLWLKEAIFKRVRPAEVHYVDGRAKDVAGECARYERLLKEAPIDLCCLGIGENGHIAFNDPPVADFKDPKLVKDVVLDEPCRVQQVNDGCFPSFDAVPKTALTLTVPALMSAKELHCVVPGPRKAAAVARTLKGPISTECPGTILRTHPAAVLYLDDDSARQVDTAIAGS